MRPKGLREIRTARPRHGQGGAGSREQAVAESARLEHERARLQRELAVWRKNGLRVEDRLRRVEARLAELRAATSEPVARPGHADRCSPPTPDEPASGWSSFTLEY